MFSRRALFRSAFIAAGFFATRRFTPKVEEDDRFHEVLAERDQTYWDEILAAFQKLLSETEWDPLPLPENAPRFPMLETFLEGRPDA